MRVVLPGDVVGLVQAGEDSIPKPEQLVGEVTSAPSIVPIMVALVASLLTRRIEDSVKGEDDMGARVSAALGVNCPGFPGLARCHQHVVCLQGESVFAGFIMKTLHKLHPKSQFRQR